MPATRIDPIPKPAALGSKPVRRTRARGSQLTDFLKTDELRIEASQGLLRASSGRPFDGAPTLGPSRRKRQQPPRAGPPGIIDNLETATVLALRLQQAKKGEISLAELAQFAQTLFATSYKSAVAEILALETEETGKSNARISDEVQRMVYQPVPRQRMAKVLLALDRHGFTKRDLDRWIKCITAPQLHAALEAMDHEDERLQHKWPKFLVLFTLRRYCNSRLAAYRLTRWFAAIYPQYSKDPTTQTKMLFRVLQGVQRWVPDLVPGVVQIALDSASPEICTSQVMNQLLWKLARFGLATADSRETSLIMRAQAPVVEKMTQRGISLDTKGYLAIGYTLREESPDRARAFLDAIRQHEYPHSAGELAAINGEPSYEGKFPYLQGPVCLEMLLTVSGDQALNVFDSIESPSAMQWAILLRQLRRLNELVPDTARALWEKIKANPKSDAISPYLLSQVMMGMGTLQDAESIVNAYPGHMSQSLALTYLKIACRNGSLSKARQLLSDMDYKPVAAYNALLAGELHHGDPHKMWAVYEQGILGAAHNHEPDVWSLHYMCRAAWDPGLVWAGLYAAQRMVVEFKHWVRGAYIDGGDAVDLLKLYPSDALFYSYIVMLGRAGYQDELLEVLPWMQRIGFEPSKLCLTALITYSPNGTYLLKHAQVAGVGTNWPSEFELRQFQNRESRQVSAK